MRVQLVKTESQTLLHAKACSCGDERLSSQDYWETNCRELFDLNRSIGKAIGQTNVPDVKKQFGALAYERIVFRWHLIREIRMRSRC